MKFATPVLVFLSSTIAACGSLQEAKQQNQTPAAAPAEKQATLIETAPAAQDCTDTNDGDLVYVKDTAEFQVCELGTWTVVDLKGKDGVDGKNGVDGKPGATGPAGTGLMGVFAPNKELVGYYLGGKEVELLSGAVGYFDFPTGAAIGVPQDEDGTSAPRLNNTCLYESSDCTGACWLGLIHHGREPEPGYVLTANRKMWRIDGDEKRVEKLTYFSYTDPQWGTCNSADVGGQTTVAIMVEHEEKLPPGLTIPFGKLTLGKVK